MTVSTSATTLSALGLALELAARVVGEVGHGEQGSCGVRQTGQPDTLVP